MEVYNVIMSKSEIALNYLEKNKILHIDMIEPIRRKTAEILYASEDGVLIIENNSDSYMLSICDIKLAMKLIDTLVKKPLFVVRQEELLPIIKEKFAYKNYFDCFQTAYLKSIPPKLNDDIQIKLLTDNDKTTVSENYKSIDEDFDYTSYLIDKKQMWGAFNGETLMGFIGIHSEGSMGLLEVLPKYRNNGIATALQSFLIDFMLKKDWIPFGQVFQDNEKSLNLQKKIGLTISKEHVFWLY